MSYESNTIYVRTIENFLRNLLHILQIREILMDKMASQILIKHKKKHYVSSYLYVLSTVINRHCAHVEEIPTNAQKRNFQFYRKFSSKIEY